MQTTCSACGLTLPGNHGETSKLERCPRCGAALRPQPGPAQPVGGWVKPAVTYESGPSGIGGWLILPAIGLVLGPIASAIGLVVLASSLTSTAEAVQEVAPGLFRALVGSLVMLLGLLGFQVYTAVLFFRKDRRVPRLVCWLYAVNFAVAVVSVIWGNSVTGEGLDPSDVKSIARAAIQAAIWIPYFRVSKRVANTFVR